MIRSWWNGRSGFLAAPLLFGTALVVSALPARVTRAQPVSVEATSTAAASTDAAKAEASPAVKLPKPAPDYGIPQVARINEEIRTAWIDYDLKPSPPATDGEWCRRLYLDLLGRVPSVQELGAFLADTSPDKKAKLVNTLLSSDDYVEDYARNWTTVWTTVLIGRTGGNDQNSLISRAGMQKYLRDSFARNKPYDRMVEELVTATGVTTPGSEGFNGAVNFLVDKVNEEDATLATADTSRIFLGLQVQCTQCHNHPFNEWKQQKFWEMNAFFRQTRALRTFAPGGNMVSSAELVNEDFAGEGGNPVEAELYYELRNGLLKVAYPVFVDGTDVPKSGFVSDVVRRNELSKFMVNSDYLEKTMANRMWAHFLGYGFTKPIDDMGPHNPPSNPILLDYLAEQFRKNSFNVKELIRWIALSEAYSLSSRVTEDNQLDDPLLGEKPRFTHFYLRQMEAEQLYESLLVATQAHKTRGSYEEQEAKKADWLGQFVQAFGTDAGGETTSFNGTIPQVLMMFNGDLIRDATSNEPGSYLTTISSSKLSSRDKINYIYLSALARKPSDKELAIANELLRARRGDETAALQDMFWAVLNSNEFIFNH
ncbi:MAG TPA: DUF1549 domain-containing protein [Pirellulaceae bacterium]|jgi:hypothetical protein|nr:DUF1549 domain-containing protein [Pirellulaceae bacterium]